MYKKAWCTACRMFTFAYALLTLDSFLCRYEKVSCIVWSPIGHVNLRIRDQLSSIVWTPLQYVNPRFRDRRGADSRFLFVNRSLIRYGFRAGAKATIRHSVTLALVWFILLLLVKDTQYWLIIKLIVNCLCIPNAFWFVLRAGWEHA